MMKKAKKIKIITSSVRLRRKLACIRDKLYNQAKEYRQKQNFDKTVKTIRKKYVASGGYSVAVPVYALPFDLTPHLDALHQSGAITYNKEDSQYKINIEEVRDESI